MAMLSAKDEERKRYDEVGSLIRKEVDAISNADTANASIEKSKSVEHVGSSSNLAKSLISAKAKELGLVFDKESKTYSDADTAA